MFISSKSQKHTKKNRLEYRIKCTYCIYMRVERGARIYFVLKSSKPNEFFSFVTSAQDTMILKYMSLQECSRRSNTTLDPHCRSARAAAVVRTLTTALSWCPTPTLRTGMSSRSSVTTRPRVTTCLKAPCSSTTAPSMIMWTT